MLGSLRQNASCGTTWGAKITKRANHGPYLCLFLHMQLELGHLKPYSCPDPLGLHSDSHHPTEDSRPFNLAEADAPASGISHGGRNKAKTSTSWSNQSQQNNCLYILFEAQDSATQVPTNNSSKKPPHGSNKFAKNLLGFGSTTHAHNK